VLTDSGRGLRRGEKFNIGNELKEK